MTPDEPPPFLGRWPRVYVAVLVYLVLLVTLFWLFTRAFNVTAKTAPGLSVPSASAKTVAGLSVLSVFCAWTELPVTAFAPCPATKV